MTLRDRPVARHLVGGVLAAGYLVLLIQSAGTLGFARDEGFYYHAALDYQRWFDVLLQDPRAAFTQREIDRRWRYNHEHPALMKTLFGLSWRVLARDGGPLPPSLALRLPAMALAALCVYLTVLFGWRWGGPIAGLAAGALLAAQPRFFYHAHLACFDVPVTTMWLATVYGYLKSRESRRWAWLTGVLFGLCLCTKLNAFFIPPVLAVHHLAMWWSERRAGVRPRPLVAPVFVAMALIGPLIFMLHWPWIWFETAERVGFYLGFHRAHPHYNMEYFGVTYFRPPVPVSFPFVMTVATLPLTTTVLAALGAALRFGPFLPRRLVGGIAPGAKRPARDPLGTGLLVGLCALWPLLIIAHPSVPIFGATKHWLPAMPMIAVLAGIGAARVVAGLRPRRAVASLALALLLLPAFVETAASHPFGLSHYSVAVGGVRGAANLGLNRQFWGYTTGSLVEWLNGHARPGARVFFHDTAYDALRMYWDDGTLRRDLRWSSTDAADLALVHHEQHMAHVEYEIWERFGTTAPVHVLTHDGVPVISVYERPPTRQGGRP